MATKYGHCCRQKKIFYRHKNLYFVYKLFNFTFKKKIDKIATSPGVYKRVEASPSDTRDFFFYFLAVSPGLYHAPNTAGTTPFPTRAVLVS
jgi:hypothetical protein